MKLRLGKERVIVQGMPPEENWWGKYQFPVPYKLSDKIVVSVHTEDDDIYNQGVTRRWFESRDKGQTWNEISPDSAPECGLTLPSGDRLYFPFLSGQSLQNYKETPIELLTPDYDFSKRAEEGTLPIQDGITYFTCGSQIKAYRADRLPESLDQRNWTAYRIPQGAVKAVKESVAVDWKCLTRVVIHHKPGDSGILKPINPRGNLKIGPDGAIWISDFSGEGHINPVNGQFSPYYSAELFRSQDNGHRFEHRGHLEYEADGKYYPYQSGGFSDSDFAFMPDGSIVWFLRSTWAAYTGIEWGPMYMARSEDKGYTWSKPVRFSEMGVLPRLCTLGCGVTLLCYARPGIYVRVCENDSGTKWSKPLVVMKPENRSGLANSVIKTPTWHQWDGQCGNPEIIAIDDTSALLVYGDFYYPDKHGVKRKSILCRTINVEA